MAHALFKSELCWAFQLPAASDLINEAQRSSSIFVPLGCKTSCFFGGPVLFLCSSANKEIKVICAAGLTVEVRLLADRTRWAMTTRRGTRETLETWGFSLPQWRSDTQWTKRMKLNQVAFFGGGSVRYPRWWFQISFIFTPTNIFQMGWNHQLVSYSSIFHGHPCPSFASLIGWRYPGVGRAKPLLLPRFTQSHHSTDKLESLLFPSNLCNVWDGTVYNT